jgi:hypothetical protein
MEKLLLECSDKYKDVRKYVSNRYPDMHQEAISNHPNSFVSLVTLKNCSQVGPDKFSFIFYVT